MLTYFNPLQYSDLQTPTTSFNVSKIRIFSTLSKKMSVKALKYIIIYYYTLYYMLYNIYNNM